MSHCSSFIKRAYNIIRNDAGIDGDAQRIEKIARIFFFARSTQPRSKRGKEKVIMIDPLFPERSVGSIERMMKKADTP